MIERCGPGDVAEFAGEGRGLRAVGVDRLDADEHGSVHAGAVVRHRSRHERPDAHRHHDQLRLLQAAGRDGLVHLGEDGGVALDHLRGDGLVARPRGVGHHDAALAGLLGRPGDGVVVVTRNHRDLGALPLHGLDAGRRHPRGHVDLGVEPQQAGHEGHSPAVVAVCCGAQLQRAQVGQAGREFIDVSPAGRRGADVIADGPVGGPGGAEDLERRQPHAASLGLDQESPHAQPFGQVRGVEQERRRVGRHPAVECGDLGRGRRPVVLGAQRVGGDQYRHHGSSLSVRYSTSLADSRPPRGVSNGHEQSLSVGAAAGPRTDPESWPAGIGTQRSDADHLVARRTGRSSRRRIREPIGGLGRRQG